MDFYDDFEIDSSLDVALADDFLTSIEEDEAREQSIFDEDYEEDSDDYNENLDDEYKSNIPKFEPKAYLNEYASIELVNELLDGKGISEEERLSELYFFKRINYILGDSPLPAKLARLILGETTMEQYYNDNYKSYDTQYIDTSALDMSIEDLLD